MSRPRWRVERREGWSEAIHPTEGVVLITTDHTSAIAYADRLARQETPARDLL